ncbi:MAG: hypothetical protein VYB54_07480 [Pseudomonadota bacterium]|nr:hypothetical protein [Pseudomonadota bacterium]
MAISYPLSLPSVRALTTDWEAVNTAGMNRSPFTGAEQIYAWSGEWWRCSVSLPPMALADADAWVAFLVSLRGRYGTFLLGDPLKTSPRGVGTGTPVVAGGSQTGYSLDTDGWSASTPGILAAGDWIQLGSGSGSRLHKVVQSADSDSAGAATLEIWPALRASPADNDPITLASTRGVFRLDGNITSWSVDKARTYGINFTAVEALGAS